MSTRMTIGQLSRAVGVPASTVRYYERRGLLGPLSRSASNYRLYGEESMARLEFVRSAQAAGFTLSDIAALLRLRDRPTTPCAEVQSLIGSRLEHVSQQLSHIKHVESVLRSWLGICRKAARTGRCGVLEGLSAPPRDHFSKSAKSS